MKIDKRYYPLLSNHSKNIDLSQIEDMLKQFSAMFKSLLPKLFGSENKFFALAIEGLWKFIIMIIDNALKRTVIKVQSFDEMKLRDKYEKREQELLAEIKTLKKELEAPSILMEM